MSDGPCDLVYLRAPVKLFIDHLQRLPVQVDLSSHSYKLFVHTVTRASVFGVVVGIIDAKNYYLLTLNDGTGEVDCYLSRDLHDLELVKLKMGILCTVSGIIRRNLDNGAKTLSVLSIRELSDPYEEIISWLERIDLLRYYAGESDSSARISTMQMHENSISDADAEEAASYLVNRLETEVFSSKTSEFTYEHLSSLLVNKVRSIINSRLGSPESDITASLVWDLIGKSIELLVAWKRLVRIGEEPREIPDHGGIFEFFSAVEDFLPMLEDVGDFRDEYAMETARRRRSGIPKAQVTEMLRYLVREGLLIENDENHFEFNSNQISGFL